MDLRNEQQGIVLTIENASSKAFHVVAKQRRV